MALPSLIAVFIGAGIGAVLRWWLALAFNSIFPTIPLGTLAANLLGGYLIGAATALFSLKASLPAEARLPVVTGFLGGLTTFSTFSNEVVTLSTGEEFAWAAGAVALHVLRSLAMTALGLVSMRWLLLGDWAIG
ncbi:MAG TPA: fluoride efflux transporter CrcB [Burkholderiaceae bacterium]|nr:fluoride efflux transporter CrcB [Burkholderiaceae bacterium]